MAEHRLGNRNTRDYLLVFLKGMAMGMADSVPGVSGGTIAVITRIYDELIYAIRAFDLEALKLLLNGEIRKAWHQVNGNFLLTLLSGIVISLWLSAQVVLALLESQFEVLMAFFIGLVLASSWYLRRETGSWNWKTGLALLTGAALTLLVGTLTPAAINVSYIYLFFCGLVAICAMILPGLSGAFILLVLGVYDHVLNALINFELSVILVFVTGCILGLLMFSRILAWALHSHRELSYAFLTGMLLASIYVLWPWQQSTGVGADSEGHTLALQSSNLLPGQFQAMTGQDPRVLTVMIALMSGILLIALFEKLFRKPAT